MDLARELGQVEIVVADSMQVYRGMDIGTAKPSRADRADIPHHLLDLIEPGEECTVTSWLQAARRVVTDIEDRGRRALVVGGTGLYFQALIDDLRPPGRYPEVREALESETDTRLLYERLIRLDPVAADRIEPGNRRRTVRALEVTLGSGRPFSSFGPGMDRYPPTSWRIVGLWLPRPVVTSRIGARLRSMLDAGWVEEVEGIRAGGLSRTARQALGYREILDHLENGTSLVEAMATAERRTRAFARRQRVWWRRDPRIRWYGADENPFAVIPQLLGNWMTP
jgi:tRNA dimethylallyltransferase